MAIKVLHQHLNPAFESRFRREALAIAQLQHPSILPIYDAGEREGLLYFVMQHIENGVTLADLIADRPLDAVEAARLVRPLLDALDYAHGRGVIHRDIKPSNVLMPLPYWPLLADFGIAKPPTSAPAPSPTPAPPEPSAAPQPTSLPEPTSAPPTAAPEVTRRGAEAAVRLEDGDWQGGFRSAGRTYGGRSATWIYGTATEYSEMRAALVLEGQPAGTAQLTIEGMDSENAPRTLISITVNGVEIYRDRNPLPDDDHQLETGRWGSYTWSFDASLLQPGQNRITIANLDEGAFSRPPFFMLDYADLMVEFEQ